MAPVTQANDIMVKLDMLESQLKRIDLLDDQLKSLQEIVDRHEFKLKYPDFKQIGSRYFYIENTSTQYWPTAASTCHEMGGYLAGIKDLDELEAISHYLMKNTWYWIGIRNVNIGEFKYSATGKQARFLKWGYGYPENYDSYNCVYLYNGLMYNYSCDSSNRFICQVDKDI
ncbi:accessory gland protein Acp29AB-like [Drosophila rhopaloa]|uniref:C-type lectin domain-containing protein n=1 Tax=Drosophila rhopaloa TaxID=1041015 RepID=A0ABM5H8B2_DRORH|nr:accessory gland protein Acp29AB-like [Drosophila rhopaloa]